MREQTYRFISCKKPKYPLLTQPQADDDEYANQNRQQQRDLAVIGDKIIYTERIDEKRNSIYNVYVDGQAAPLMQGLATGFQVDGIYLYHIDESELTDGTVHIDLMKKAPHPSALCLMRLNLQTGEREKLIDGCGSFQCHDGYIYYTSSYDGWGYMKTDEAVPDKLLQEEGNLYRIDMDGSNRKLVYGREDGSNRDVYSYLFFNNGLLILTKEDEGGSSRYYYVYCTILEGQVEILWNALVNKNATRESKN